MAMARRVHKRTPFIKYLFRLFVLILVGMFASIVITMNSLKNESFALPPNGTDNYTTHWSESLQTIEIRDVSNYSRIVVVGDLHGELSAIQRILQLSNIVDSNNDWIARDTILIQTGDIIDRGPASIDIYYLFLKLRQQCIKYNSLVLNQIGNHEHLNFINDFRYVDASELRKYGGLTEWKRLLSMQTPVGRFIRNMPMARIVGNSLFVHAGILPAVAKAFGNDIMELNQQFHESIQKISSNTDNIDPLLYFQTLTATEEPLFGLQSPIWTRFFEPAYYDMNMMYTAFQHAAAKYAGKLEELNALTQNERINLFLCDMVKQVLEIYNVKRMITGHNVQTSGEIESRCDGGLYRIDVGMAKFYGGNLAALEIHAPTDTVRIVTDPDNPAKSMQVAN